MIRYIEKLVNWFEELFDPSTPGRFEHELKTSTEDSALSNGLNGRNASSKGPLRLRRWLFVMRRRRGLILRSLLCWGMGFLALHLDEISNYDFRLSLRGNQSPIEDIVILSISDDDLKHYFHHSSAQLPRKATPTFSADSAYWDRDIWKKMISELLSLQPKSIGVTFFFDDRLRATLTHEDLELFTHERIIWMGAQSQSGLFQAPPFTTIHDNNFGYSDINRDEDGMIRSIVPVHGPFKPFSVRVSELGTPTYSVDYPKRKAIINFRGSHQTLRQFSLSDFLEHRIPLSSFRNQIVLIGAASDNQALGSFATPVGPLTRAELLAQIVDNNIHGRWIQRVPNSVAILELLLVMILSVFLMQYFPQKVAFVFLSLLALALSSVSLWFFDTFYIWTPTFSPLIEIFGTWILFVGYLASRIEHKNWQLEQEKKSHAQLEQLKNNFVSLISHDLKTPIAKIQAIVDRLLLNEVESSVGTDLKVLRSCSQELHRYIQSILKILKVESKDFHLTIEVADINELVSKALQQVEPLAKEKNIFIQAQLEPLFSVEVDPTLLQEVFSNILENAIKYTPPGGSVSVQTSEEDDKIQIRVSDNGEGIAPEELEGIFGKFVRGKNQDHKTKGTGLGLYLVKYFIELHGGSVSLKSQVGQGTTVDLFLPTVS